MSNNFTLHTIGCGSAKPSVRHNPSSTVIDYHGNLFMFDCGEGSQREFQRQHLKFSRLGHVFLTHLHGDHVFGLPGLIGTLALSGTGGEIVVHTIEEGRKILSEIFNYFNRDLILNVRFNVFDPEKENLIFENNSITVRTIPLRHRIPTAGYVMEEKIKPRHINREMCDFHDVPLSWMDRLRGGQDFVKPDGTIVPNVLLTREPSESLSYAHISDTAFFPELAEKIGPVTLLFHETTYLDDKKEKARQRGHSTASEAATIAKLSGAKALLTGHYSSSVKDDTLFQKEAEEVFPNVILNKEGLALELDTL